MHCSSVRRYGHEKQAPAWRALPWPGGACGRAARSRRSSRRPRACPPASRPVAPAHTAQNDMLVLPYSVSTDTLLTTGHPGELWPSSITRHQASTSPVRNWHPPPGRHLVVLHRALVPASAPPQLADLRTYSAATASCAGISTPRVPTAPNLESLLQRLGSVYQPLLRISTPRVTHLVQDGHGDRLPAAPASALPLRLHLTAEKTPVSRGTPVSRSRNEAEKTPGAVSRAPCLQPK